MRAKVDFLSKSKRGGRSSLRRKQISRLLTRDSNVRKCSQHEALAVVGIAVDRLVARTLQEA